MARRKKGLLGHFVITIALFTGLLINVSANIIYELVKDNPLLVGGLLLLTIVAFIVIITTYHSRVREPLGKILQEFE